METGKYSHKQERDIFEIFLCTAASSWSCSPACSPSSPIFLRYFVFSFDLYSLLDQIKNCFPLTAASSWCCSPACSPSSRWRRSATSTSRTSGSGSSSALRDKRFLFISNKLIKKQTDQQTHETNKLIKKQTQLAKSCSHGPEFAFLHPKQTRTKWLKMVSNHILILFAHTALFSPKQFQSPNNFDTNRLAKWLL